VLLQGTNPLRWLFALPLYPWWAAPRVALNWSGRSETWDFNENPYLCEHVDSTRNLTEIYVKIADGLHHFVLRPFALVVLSIFLWKYIPVLHKM
jgi:hypothetical protein